MATAAKLAFGSGGLFGRGFLQGSQSHLSFLPERQTDFISTMRADELGIVRVPLPLICYGGTAMLTVLAGFGIIMSVYINRDMRIGRRGGVAED